MRGERVERQFQISDSESFLSGVISGGSRNPDYLFKPWLSPNQRKLGALLVVTDASRASTSCQNPPLAKGGNVT